MKQINYGEIQASFDGRRKYTLTDFCLEFLKKDKAKIFLEKLLENPLSVDEQEDGGYFQDRPAALSDLLLETAAVAFAVGYVHGQAFPIPSKSSKRVLDSLKTGLMEKGLLAECFRTGRKK